LVRAVLQRLALGRALFVEVELAAPGGQLRFVLGLQPLLGRLDQLDVDLVRLALDVLEQVLVFALVALE
jgi:hypothetical protein